MWCANTSLPAYGGAFLVLHIAFPTNPIIIVQDDPYYEGNMVFTASNYTYINSLSSSWRVTVTTSNEGTGTWVTVTETGNGARRTSQHYGNVCPVGLHVTAMAPLVGEQYAPVDVLLHAPTAVGVYTDSWSVLTPVSHKAPLGEITYSNNVLTLVVQLDVAYGVPIARLSSITLGSITTTYTSTIRPLVTSVPTRGTITGNTNASSMAVALAYFASVTISGWPTSTVTVYPMHAAAGRAGLLDNGLWPPPPYNGTTTEAAASDDAAMQPTTGEIVRVVGGDVYWRDEYFASCADTHLVPLYDCTLMAVCVDTTRVRVFEFVGDNTTNLYHTWLHTGTYTHFWIASEGGCDGNWGVYGVLDGQLVLYVPGDDPLPLLTADLIHVGYSDSIHIVYGSCLRSCEMVVAVAGLMDLSDAVNVTVTQAPLLSFSGAVVGIVPVNTSMHAPSFNAVDGLVVFVAADNKVYRCFIADEVAWNVAFSAQVTSIHVAGQFIGLGGNETLIFNAASIVRTNDTVFEIGGSHLYSRQYTNSSGRFAGFALHDSRLALIWAGATTSWTDGIVFCNTDNATSMALHMIPYGEDWCTPPEAGSLHPQLDGGCTFAQTDTCEDITLPSLQPSAWNGSSFSAALPTPRDRYCSVHDHKLPATLMTLFTGSTTSTPTCTTMSMSIYADSPPTHTHKAVVKGVRLPITLPPRPTYNAVSTWTPPSIPCTGYTIGGVCKPVTQCANNEHVTVAATATTDAVCRIRVLSCPPNTYMNLSAAQTNATGDQCPPCPPGTHAYTYHTNTSCTNNTVCPTDQYLSGTHCIACRVCTDYTVTTCTPTSNTVCTVGAPAPPPCPPRQYMDDGVGASGRCLPCSICYMQKQACTNAHDTVCYAFSHDSFAFELVLVTLMVNLVFTLYTRVWHFNNNI